MTIFIIVGLAILAIVYIGLPLFRAEAGAETLPSEEDSDDSEHDLEDLLAQRDATYRAIKEIEFDFQVGNLSEADFADLRERYKARALSLIRAIRELEQAQRDEAIEPPVSAVEATSSPADSALGDDLFERAVAGRRRFLKAAACPACGQAYHPKDRFCRHCGRPLAAFCPACGGPCEPGENFCARCGAPLRSIPDVAATIS